MAVFMLLQMLAYLLGSTITESENNAEGKCESTAELSSSILGLYYQTVERNFGTIN